ncbi:hypothetical protein WMF36_09600 [Sorangium sp. So ce887]
MKAWRRDAGREAAQERERIHVHRDSPVSEGALEREPHQAVLLRLDALVCDRGSQHVAQQRLPRRGMVRTGARRCVQGEAIERSAQRLVVSERARTIRREPAEPLRAGGRLSSRDGGGTERGLGLVVLLDVVLDLAMPVPPEVTEHPPDGVLQDLIDLARSQVTEFVPHEPLSLENDAISTAYPCIDDEAAFTPQPAGV